MSHATLSPDQLRQVLKCADLAPSQEDQRAAQRAAFCATITIAAIEEEAVGSAFAVTLQDLSATGLGFLHSQALHSGDRFVIRPTRVELPVNIIFQVVFCAAALDGRYRVGAKFTNIVGTRRNMDELATDPLARAILSSGCSH